MDDIDLRIIETLAKDSRASFREIAKKTGLSIDTVIRRYERLEKDGEIQPTIIVDSKKLGYEALAYFAVRVATKDSLSKVVEAASRIPDVTTIMKATGEYDLMLVACVRNVTHAFKVGEEIEATPDIRSVVLDLFLPLPKEDASFPPPDWHNLHTKAL